MIFLEGKVYAKVWRVTPAQNGKYIDLQITTSEKTEEDEYLNSSWFPRCIGKAVNALKNVKRGDKIIIKKVKFTNERKKQEDDTYKSYFKFLILDADIDGDNGENSTPPSAKNSKPKETMQAEEKTEAEAEADCPW